MANITLRLSEELHNRLKAEAVAERRSLHAQIIYLLEKAQQTAASDRLSGAGEALGEG